jgi:hypothetical protein
VLIEARVSALHAPDLRVHRGCGMEDVKDREDLPADGKLEAMKGVVGADQIGAKTPGRTRSCRPRSRGLWPWLPTFLACRRRKIVERRRARGLEMGRAEHQ